MEAYITTSSNQPCKLIVTDLYLFWQKPQKKLIFPYEDIIGSQVIQSSLSILAFNRLSNKLKTYDLTPSNPSDLFPLHSLIQSHTIPSQRSLAIFINPISGKKQGPKLFNNHLCKILSYSQTPHKIFNITSPNYFESFNPSELSPFTHIIILGGDGTMQELLTLLYKSGLIHNFVFGILPVGSQNALSCELTGKNLNSALVAVVKGKHSKYDLMKVTLDGEVFICTTAVCWGLVSDIAEQAQRFRAMGPLRYVFTSVLRIFASWKSFRANLRFEQENKDGEFLTILVGNHRTQNFYGNEIVFPFGKFDDGKIDLQVVDYVGRVGTVKLMAGMSNFGSHVKQDCVRYCKTGKVEIVQENHRVFNLDGEMKYGKHLVVEVLPSFIQFLTI